MILKALVRGIPPAIRGPPLKLEKTRAMIDKSDSRRSSKLPTGIVIEDIDAPLEV